MSTDLAQASILEERENSAAVSSAETVLLDSNHNAGRAAGNVMGGPRFDTVASRTAQERGQWAVQQPDVEGRGSSRRSSDSTADQVLVRVCAGGGPAFL